MSDLKEETSGAGPGAAATGAAAPAAREVHLLWPSTPPGTPDGFPPVAIIERSDIPFISDRIIKSVSAPSLTMIRPQKPNGAAVIMAPGGGYAHIVLDKEGREIADWLSAAGITTFLLTYRLPGEGHEAGPATPLQDAQRALRLVRHNAATWGLDPQRIGMMGGSAGGHVAASLIANFARKVYEPVDEIDAVSARPDFGILLYPVITMADPLAHPDSRRLMIGDVADGDDIALYSPDQNLPADAPEVFMALSDEDNAVASENALLLYLSYRRRKVPAEIHIFRDGEHGFGIERAAHLPARHWPMLCEAWLSRIGILSPKG